jgi:hypothetical protein
LHAALDYTAGALVCLVAIKSGSFSRNIPSLDARFNFRTIVLKFDIRPLPLPLADRCLDRLRDGHALAELPANSPEVIAAVKAGQLSGLCASKNFAKILARSELQVNLPEVPCQALQDNCPEVRPAG